MECVDPEDFIFAVALTDPGGERVQLTKLIRHYRPNLTLAAAKELIKSPQATVLPEVDILKIRSVVRSFSALGATVELIGPYAQNWQALERIMWPGGIIGK